MQQYRLYSPSRINICLVSSQISRGNVFYDLQNGEIPRTTTHIKHMQRTFAMKNHAFISIFTTGTW